VTSRLRTLTDADTVRSTSLPCPPYHRRRSVVTATAPASGDYANGPPKVSRFPNARVLAALLEIGCNIPLTVSPDSCQRLLQFHLHPLRPVGKLSGGCQIRGPLILIVLVNI